MYILSINMWFQKLMKQFFFGIDSVVFNMISSIYDLLITIARTSIFTQADILDMADRIYKFLAVFMIFKVTFSLITYVVNPDDFSDKSKGLSKLSTNIIISLGMLILTPYIFNYAYRLQTIILEDNTMATIIFGDKEGVSADQNILNSAGDKMAYVTMSAFFSPNTAINELLHCTQLVSNGKFNPACSGLNEDYQELDATEAEELDIDTSNTLFNLTKSENNNFELIDLQNYVVGVEKENLGLTFRQDLAIATVNNETFVMEYKYIFSTVVGVIVILLLLVYCMDVAVRSIKLSFFQLIAPIPILSYVDPKSGKDGMFKKWYQMCFKTFLSLFIRLLALYFAIYIIDIVIKLRLVDMVDGTQQTNTFIHIFIIIGALMFAKDLPKILEGLGVKLDGDGKFFLNPLKNFEEKAFGGKNITGAARGALVGTAGVLSGAGVGRAVSGAWRGFTAGKGWKETGKAEAEMNRKMRQAKLDGSNFSGRLGSRFAGATGFRSASESIAKEKHGIDREIKRYDNQIKSIEDKIVPTKTKISDQKRFSDAVKAMEDRAKGEIEKGNGGEIGKEFLRRKAHYENLKNHGVTTTRKATEEELKNAQNKVYDLRMNKASEYDLKSAEDEYSNLMKYGVVEKREATAEEIATAEQEMNSYLANEGMKEYMTRANKDEKFDGTFSNMKKDAEKAAETIGVKLGESDDKDKSFGDIVHGQYGASKGEISELQRSIYDEEQAIAKAKEEKAKLGDELREIEKRESKAKADESAIK